MVEAIAAKKSNLTALAQVSGVISASRRILNSAILPLTYSLAVALSSNTFSGIASFQLHIWKDAIPENVFEDKHFLISTVPSLLTCIINSSGFPVWFSIILISNLPSGLFVVCNAKS